ncbi:MAG: hypothetical protein IH991_00235 [Planctomycetes bacterium]|nr:hypothetical protein [Planctomycetota bacterium]
MKPLSHAPLILFVFALLIPCTQAKEPKKEKKESQGGKVKISPMSLAGKWQLDIKAMLKALKDDEPNEQKLALFKLVLEQMKMTIEFKADGTMVIEVNALGQGEKQMGKWKLTKAGGSQGKLAFTNGKGKTEEMSVKLIDQDSLEFSPPNAPPPLNNFRLTRVKEKKKE